MASPITQINLLNSIGGIGAEAKTVVKPSIYGPAVRSAALGVWKGPIPGAAPLEQMRRFTTVPSGDTRRRWVHRKRRTRRRAPAGPGNPMIAYTITIPIGGACSPPLLGGNERHPIPKRPLLPYPPVDGSRAVLDISGAGANFCTFKSYYKVLQCWG